MFLIIRNLHKCLKMTWQWIFSNRSLVYVESSLCFKFHFLIFVTGKFHQGKNNGFKEIHWSDHVMSSLDNYLVCVFDSFIEKYVFYRFVKVRRMQHTLFIDFVPVILLGMTMQRVALFHKSSSVVQTWQVHKSILNSILFCCRRSIPCCFFLFLFWKQLLTDGMKWKSDKNSQNIFTDKKVKKMFFFL